MPSTTHRPVPLNPETSMTASFAHRLVAAAAAALASVALASGVTSLAALQGASASTAVQLALAAAPGAR